MFIMLEHFVCLLIKFFIRNIYFNIPVIHKKKKNCIKRSLDHGTDIWNCLLSYFIYLLNNYLKN